MQSCMQSIRTIHRILHIIKSSFWKFSRIRVQSNFTIQIEIIQLNSSQPADSSATVKTPHRQ